MDGQSRVSMLKGVGEKTEKALNKLGIFTVQDLLEYYPRNYDIFEAPVFPEDVVEGKVMAVTCTVFEPPAVVRAGRFPVTTLKMRSGTVCFI